ncbi:MAG: NmrA family NAD(P)-binding protein [Rhizobiaceae bacterium]|nr:NmrA family NAD(P)-binding protein [Rhizobiaceae bacterium]
MTTSAKILVTSAAGRVGSATVQMLLEKGFRVRAFVRGKDARSQRLHDLGAEIFEGNLFDYRDLEKALVGVQRVFHCPPFIENQLHVTMLLCLAVEQARVETLVLMSGWNPSASHPSSLTREHWMANNIARWMPSVDLVHVNPGIFTFTYLLSLPVTAKLGLLPLPFGDGLNAPVSEHDIARVVAAIITDPKPHIGKTYRPTGPTLLTPMDVANVIGKIVGRKVRYQNVPFSMLARAAKVRGSRPLIHRT